MKGLPPVWMHAADELYGTLRGPGKNMTVLATAIPIRRTKARGTTSRWRWCFRMARGACFIRRWGTIVGGAQLRGLMTLLERGTEWAATDA